MEEIASLIIHSRKKIIAKIFFFLDLRSLSSSEKKQHWGLDERVASLSEASKRCFVRDDGDLNIEKVRDQLTEAAFQVEMSSEALRRRRRRRQHATQTRAKKVDRQEILGPRIEEKKRTTRVLLFLRFSRKSAACCSTAFKQKYSIITFLFYLVAESQTFLHLRNFPFNCFRIGANFIWRRKLEIFLRHRSFVSCRINLIPTFHWFWNEQK